MAPGDWSMCKVFSSPCGALLACALSALVPNASAQYMNRAQEVRETLTQTVGHEPLRNVLSAGFTGVFEQRNKALVDAVRMLENDSTSEEELDDRWNHHFQDTTRAVVERLRRLADEAVRLVDDVEDPALFGQLEFVPGKVRGVARQQGKLLGAIWRANPAQARDVFVSFRALYTEEHDSLENRHEQLRRDFRSIESDAAAHREDILEVAEDLIERVDSALADADSFLQSAVRDDPDPDDIDRKLSRHVDEMLRAIEEFRDETAEALEDLSDLERDEALQIRMLNETRTRVEAMVEERNAPVANLVFDETETAIGRLHTDQPPGDVRDIGVFAPNVSDRVENHLEAFESVFVRFIERFEGVFVEAVSQGTIDEFLQPGRWESWGASIARLGVLDYLNTLSRHSDWGVRLLQMSPEDIERIEDILEEQAERLADAAERAARVASRLDRVASLERRRLLRGMFDD